jgi:FAD/FMN-containing dehydrogenase
MKKVSSWGRLNCELHELVILSDPLAIPRHIKDGHGIPRGMGRSYGDVCLNPGGVLWDTTRLDHFIAFDAQSGRLKCEAGALLRDIQRVMIPKGWILPVTPGTQFVTVGGAIANDVHGKSHHKTGSFGNHVHRLTLLRTDGERLECGPDKNPQWFSATVGGLGLTGLILEAEIQLQRVTGPWLETETIPFARLDDFFQLAQGSQGWEHTVAWIDCTGKGDTCGIFMRGNYADIPAGPLPRTKALTFPVVPPISLVNALTLKPFNTLYYTLKKKGAGRTVMHYGPFFYPLDNLLEWNRLYGPRGFYQYQCVVPDVVGQDAVRAMLSAIAGQGMGSFLAVLKTFGDIPPAGMMSFARPGVTLALDFPNNGSRTLELFERLDAIVREAGGRLNPSKDARMPRNLFEAGFPRVHEFLQFRDPGMSSGFSRRVIGV